ncbi:MAG: phosphatidylserine decarboxylase [Myxococcota bacterium]|nr:phosphatidylserine decarboxylase [Myxococcota bacterium]
MFVERPTEWLVEDAYRLGSIPLGMAALCGIFGATGLAVLFVGLTIFVGAFFRNPERAIPGDENTVVSPTDGRVIDAIEVEGPDGAKALCIAIFLSVFNVHVNRVPVAGRVVGIERSGNAYLAAFNPEAETRNVRLDVKLEMANGARVTVSQITGLIARRIVCFANVGDEILRGQRYGLIRFGSRTDVLLPPGSVAEVKKGDRVRGGSSILARLPVSSNAEVGA